MITTQASRIRSLPALLGLLACTALLAGCTAGRAGLALADEVPAAWVNEQDEAAPLGQAELAAWWSRFEDATLDSLVALALADNPDLAIARSRLEQAEARRVISRSSLFPSLGASAGSERSRSEELDTDVVSFSEGSSTGLSASWQLDLFGSNRARSRAADAELASSRASLSGVRLSIAQLVANAWFDYRATAQSVDATRASLALREESLGLSRSRQTAGLISLLELRQEEASVEDAKAQLPRLEQNLQEAGSVLAILCDTPFGELDALLESGLTGAITLPGPVSAGIPVENLRQRPDVSQAEQDYHSAVADRQVAERDRLPALTLTGSLGAGSSSATDWFAPEQLVSSLAEGLAAPLFQSGALSANVKSQQEAETQAWIEWKRTVLEAAHEVENSLTSLIRQRENREALERGRLATAEATELAMLQSNAGLADHLARLDAQRSLLATEQGLAEARAEELKAHAALYAALGGGGKENSK